MIAAAVRAGRNGSEPPAPVMLGRLCERFGVKAVLGPRPPFRRLLEIHAAANAYDLARRHGRGLGGAPLMALKDKLSAGAITEAQYAALRAFMDEGWL